MPVVDHRTSASAWSVPTGGESSGDPVEEDSSPRKVTDAARARTIVENSRTAVLGVAVGEPALPAGFVVPFVISGNGHLFVGIRPHIERAIGIDRLLQVSMTIAETPLTASHASSHGGVSLLGILSSIMQSGEQFDNAIVEYTRGQPADSGQVKRGFSKLFLFSPDKIMVTIASGTGIARVAAEEYADASSDPLAAVAPGLLTHLNGDDGGSLVLLCRAYGGQPGAVSAKLSSIDQYGMDLLVRTAHGRGSVRLNFSRPILTSDEVRHELSVMARGARFKLGVG